MSLAEIELFFSWLNLNSGGILAISTVIYMFVTWRILSENKKSYLAKYMPIVCIDYDRKEKMFNIQNIGTGLAIDVNVSKLRWLLENTDWEFQLIFDRVHNLKPGETTLLSYKEYLNNQEKAGSILAFHLYSEVSKRDFVFDVVLKDILGNIYYEKINMGKSGIFVIKHFKTWWLVRGLIFMSVKCYEGLFFVNNRIKIHRTRKK